MFIRPATSADPEIRGYMLAHDAVMPLENRPSIWFFVTTAVKGTTYLAVRNPEPFRRSTDQQSLIHVIARTVRENELLTAASAYYIDYERAAKNMLPYHLGTDVKPDAVFKHLYTEPTPLFSGEQENQPVHAVHVDIGRSFRVPTIHLPSASFVHPLRRASTPPEVRANKNALDTCTIVRKNMALVSLDHLINSVAKVPGVRGISPQFCSPSASPFIYSPAAYEKHIAPIPACKIVKIQQSMLFCLQELCSVLGKECPRWITPEQMNMARTASGYPEIKRSQTQPRARMLWSEGMTASPL